MSAIDLAPTVLDLAGISSPESVQGVSFTSILTNPQATVRNIAFAEHNWHVYKNHERMVRTADWLYIRNNFPDQQNLCVEAYLGGAGEELWQAHQADNLTPAQQNVFWNPCPPEELYQVKDDPDQLTNLADQTQYAATLQRLHRQLEQWTQQTGDTVPTNPTPHRDAPPACSAEKQKGICSPRDARG